MAEAGYIYALINPSLEGLVKIGKTRRDPTDRARELSSSTAAPTPFILAFDVYVDNCAAAESYLHTLLARRGFRVSDNREFFNAPLKEVIKAMLVVEGSQVPVATAPSDAAAGAATPGPEAEALLEEAQAYYHGEDETIEDKKEALKLFKQAARLGAPDAFYALGIMYRDGEGCDRNTEEALEYLKRGVAQGCDECHAEMALLFLQEGHEENARKCWTKYFRSDGYVRGLSGHEAAYGHAYLMNALERGSPLEYHEALGRYGKEIVAIVDEAVGEADAEAKPLLKRQRRRVKKHLGLGRW